ncbi:MAG: UDP-N-acetylmuramoyl-tripeptide--D-alanyl-D-alanine ligase [Pseudomonadota bacterium]
MTALARRLAAQTIGADAVFTRVCTDSRQIAAGDLFVALKGERYDGHEFVSRAGAKGAVGALVSQVQDCPLPQVVVADTLKGLQDYARVWRTQFDLPVVAVTGSNGKTTTKQMLSAIFDSRGPTLATAGNLNNHIGLPLTLLGLRAEHRTAVIEMGANHAGEIARLTELTRPQIGVVTQAGDAHLEGFGSREGVARAKGELFSGLGPDSVAVINHDDAFAPLWKKQAAHCAQITFSLTERADVSALNIEPQPAGAGIRFELRAAEGRVPVQLPLAGRHNVSNALASASCAVALGMDLKDIAAGLARVKPAAGRLSWMTTASGARVLDDSYNANPTSLSAGLDVLAACSGLRILVLGDMGELGSDSERLHHEAGAAAKQRGIDALYATGPLSQQAVKGFGAGAQHFADTDALISALRPRLDSRSFLLVKGSRSSRMERVVAALTGQTSEESH